MKRPEFDKAKEEGLLVPSMGKLPVFEVGGVRVGQSKAIERFVAKKVGMMGADDIEAFQIDALCCNVIDIKEAYNKAKAAGGDNKEEAQKTFVSEKLPEMLA